MKLRFRQNTMRLRLNQQEVSKLAAGVALREEVRFPGATLLEYVLEPGTSKGATYASGVIRITAPQEDLTRWAQGDGIGFYFELTAETASLHVAIEKDLECLDGPEAERDLHAFPRAQNRAC